MYPELFRIPYFDLPVSSFGPMLALAFLVGLWITTRSMGERGYEADLVSTLWIYVLFGGIFGSKLYFAIDNWILYGLPFDQLLFSRGGITWYGGLIGGTLAGSFAAWRHGIPIATVANCAAPAAAVGQAIGRIGCFLVGDDYGSRTDVPWAVAFPEGAPPIFERVHPTQLYEVIWLLPVAALLWSRRKKSPFLFGEYIALNGLGRIVIENWRVNPAVALGLTEPQWIGVGLVVAGVGGWLYFHFQRAAEA
ncbi:MAG: prolipoprotein diacylglyceryl transferase family protein [Myxococcota bacterium]